MEVSFDPNIVTEFERETWGRCAESYANTFAGITQETIPLLIDMAKIKSGTEVLEIGSGPGHVADTLARAGAEVVGIDFSPEMVSIATRAYPEIDFKQADAEDIPFEATTFDAVIANFVVHHLAQPEKVFREITRVLKPGGRFVFAVWGPPQEQSSMGAFFGAVATHHDMADLPHGPLFGITQSSVFEPMFEQAGLSDPQLSIHNMTWRTNSIDPILKGFWDWGKMNALPDETQDNIRQSTITNSKPFKKGSGYEFPHPILFGSASRRVQQR